jgi:hypothetical protein
MVRILCLPFLALTVLAGGIAIMHPTPAQAGIKKVCFEECIVWNELGECEAWACPDQDRLPSSTPRKAI